MKLTAHLLRPFFESNFAIKPVSEVTGIVDTRLSTIRRGAAFPTNPEIRSLAAAFQVSPRDIVEECDRATQARVVEARRMYAEKEVAVPSSALS